MMDIEQAKIELLKVNEDIANFKVYFRQQQGKFFHGQENKGLSEFELESLWENQKIGLDDEFRKLKDRRFELQKFIQTFKMEHNIRTQYIVLEEILMELKEINKKLVK
jgi:hypothetical protein